MAGECYRDCELRNAVHRIRQLECFASAFRSAHLGILREQAEPHQQSQQQGPHTLTQWIARSAFQRLDPVTQAGEFGNAGRNIARGPGFADVDLSLMKTFVLIPEGRLCSSERKASTLQTIRISGCRCRIWHNSELWPYTFGWNCAFDAVRIEGHLLATLSAFGTPVAREQRHSGPTPRVTALCLSQGVLYCRDE